MKKGINVYIATIIEVGPEVFAVTYVATSPEELARKVDFALQTEENERDFVLEAHDPDTLYESCKYGSRGEPDIFVDKDGYHTFYVVFSGPQGVAVPEEKSEEETLSAPQAGQEEVVKVMLHPDGAEYPIASRAKLEELIEERAFDSPADAKKWMRQTPFELELIYEKGCGLFAVESQAVETDSLRSPYSGKRIITPTEQ